MGNSTMKAVAVVPGKKELRLVDHPLPQVSSETQIKVKTLDVGVVLLKCDDSLVVPLLVLNLK